MYRVCLIFCVMSILLIPSLVFAQEDSTPISLGQVVTGEITDEKPRDFYSFDGVAGDTITISMRATTEGLDSYVELQGPNGEQYFNDDSFSSLNSMLLVSLPSNGTYTVVATRCCGEGETGSTGTYELSVNAVTVSPIDVGVTTPVAVDSSQPLAFLSLSGASGQIVSLYAERVEGDASFVIDLRNPSGEPISSVFQNEVGIGTLEPLFLDDTGDYLLMVSRQFAFGGELSGEQVSLNVTIEIVETQPIAIGETISGTLDDSNLSDHYVFSAANTDLLRVTGNQASGDQTYEMIVYSMQGTSVASQNTSYPTEGSFVLDPMQVPETGEYLLFVRRFDFEGSGELGTTNYSITLGPSEVVSLESGVEVVGSFDAETSLITYRFEGASGQTIRITLESTNEDYAPSLNVQGPRLEGSVEGDFRPLNFYINISGSSAALVTYESQLPSDGTYLFQVSNSAYGETGVLAGEFRLVVDVIE